MQPPDPGPPRPHVRRLRAILELLRPANVATALADVLAGSAVATGGQALATLTPSLGWLLLATAGLYAGGIVLNDVFDRHLDALERPERPIPSGRVPVGVAAALGGALLAVGVAAAAAAGPVPALLAGAVSLAVLTYNAAAKRHAFLGPFTMGLCRALNLLLGVALVPAALAWAWPLALLPLVYIAAVTTVSRGEVHGARRPVLVAGLALVTAVVGALAAVAVAGGRPPADTAWALCLAGAVGWRVLPAFGRAVRTGVLSLVLVDAAITASYAGIMNSLAVLATGLLAWGLARLFAVT